MSLTKKILSNTFWQMFGRLVTAVIAFITVSMLTRYWGGGNVEIGRAQYGMYATIYEFLAIFGAIADFGIFTIAVREMSKHKDKQPEIFSATVILRVVSLIGALLLAVLIAYMIPQYRGTVIPQGVLIVALGTGIFILSGTFSTILLVHLNMVWHAIGLVVGKLVTFGFILAAIFFLSPEPSRESFFDVLWAGTWGSAATLLITLFGARQYMKFRFTKNVELMKEIWWMAFPFGVAIFLNTIYFRLGITMMGILLPHSAPDGSCAALMCGDQQAGMYAVAVRIMEVMILFPLYFMNSVLPSLSSGIQEGKTEEVKRRLSRSVLFLSILVFPMVMGLGTLATPIVSLLTPENFGSDVALKILCVPLLLTFFTTFINFSLIAHGEQKKILWINFWAVILNFTLNFWAIPRYGFVGAALTALLSEAFILIFGTIILRRITRFEFPWKKLLGILFSTLVMGAVVVFSYNEWAYAWGIPGVLGVVALGGGVYGLLILLLRIIDIEFLKMFLPKKGAPAEIPSDIQP